MLRATASVRTAGRAVAAPGRQGALCCSHLCLLFAILLVHTSDLPAQGQEPPLPQPNVPVPSQDEELVLLLQKSGTPTDTSYARLLNDFKELSVFTVCYRIRMHRYREEGAILSYALSEQQDNEIRVDHRHRSYKVAIHSLWTQAALVTPLEYWSHFCFTFTNADNSVTIYHNGAFKTKGNIKYPKGVLKSGGTFIIGQEQDSLGGDFQRDQSYSGEITQLNVWDYILDEKTINDVSWYINDIYECRSSLEGSDQGWSQMHWNISGEAEWILQPKADVCSKKQRTVIFFPDRFKLSAAIIMCNVVGGNIAVPLNADENKQLNAISKDRAEKCSGNIGKNYLWLGIHDDDEEGRWDKFGSNETIQYQGPWRGGAPNGGTVENCVVMLYHHFDGLWSDIACLDTYSFCMACDFEKYPTIYMKGQLLCNLSPFDTKYILFTDINGRPSLTGYFHTDIYWNNDTFSWIMISRKEPRALAQYTPSSPDRYPFGKNLWMVTDFTVCNVMMGSQVLMTLSSCAENMYTCDDGTCIILAKRCDLRVDCSDQSDEEGCTLLDMKKSYSSTIPPPPTIPSKPLNLNLSISLIAFPAIKTEELSFQANLRLKLIWQDIRLNFLNLKDERSLNKIPAVDVSKLWIPIVFFRNAYGNLFSNLDEGSQVECVKAGQPVPGDSSYANEVNIFSGYENSLEVSQLYEASYSCDFDLLMFPFDAQDCYMSFTLVSASSSYMILKPNVMEYIGNKELIEYTIGDRVSVSEDVNGEFSEVKIGVRFQRRSGFYLLTLYIPTVLLAIIAYASLFFDPIDFNSRISVALTSLLVLASLFSQTSNSLPKTSYFKLIDIWLFFSIVIIFFVVTFQTIVEYYSFDPLLISSKSNDVQIFKVEPARRLGPSTRLESVTEKLHNASVFKSKDGKTPLNIKILIMSRIIVPILYIIFNIVYWATTLTYLVEVQSKGTQMQEEKK